jgi:hypothetical protein
VTARFAEPPKQIGLLLLPFCEITKIYIGKLAGLDDASHHFLCLHDDLGRSAEPQIPDKRLKTGKL